MENFKDFFCGFLTESDENVQQKQLYAFKSYQYNGRYYIGTENFFRLHGIEDFGGNNSFAKCRYYKKYGGYVTSGYLSKHDGEENIQVIKNPIVVKDGEEENVKGFLASPAAKNPRNNRLFGIESRIVQEDERFKSQMEEINDKIATPYQISENGKNFIFPYLENFGVQYTEERLSRAQKVISSDEYKNLFDIRSIVAENSDNGEKENENNGFSMDLGQKANGLTPFEYEKFVSQAFNELFEYGKFNNLISQQVGGAQHSDVIVKNTESNESFYLEVKKTLETASYFKFSMIYDVSKGIIDCQDETKKTELKLNEILLNLWKKDGESKESDIGKQFNAFSNKITNFFNSLPENEGFKDIVGIKDDIKIQSLPDDFVKIVKIFNFYVFELKKDYLKMRSMYLYGKITNDFKRYGINKASIEKIKKNIRSVDNVITGNEEWNDVEGKTIEKFKFIYKKFISTDINMRNDEENTYKLFHVRVSRDLKNDVAEKIKKYYESKKVAYFVIGKNIFLLKEDNDPFGLKCSTFDDLIECSELDVDISVRNFRFHLEVKLHDVKPEKIKTFSIPTENNEQWNNDIISAMQKSPWVGSNSGVNKIQETIMTEEYIKYLATLCEGRNLLREHEHYYDPETGMSYDDEGNSWRGAPNPKYDVSGYWPHTGRNAWWRGGGYPRRTKRTYAPLQKEIDKDKLYFGRPANTEGALVYFLLQACGLYLGRYKLPSGVEKRTSDEYISNIISLSQELSGKKISGFKKQKNNDTYIDVIFRNCILYFKQQKGKRDSSNIKGVIDDCFETT